MSYWVVQSFAVENPKERLAKIRSRLTLEDDFTTVVDTEPSEDADKQRQDAQYEVLAMTTSRLSQPDMESAYDITPDDETLFGPFMDFVLEPGEYGCVLGVNDTSNSGYGSVYYKREKDREIVVKDDVSGGEGGFGEYAAADCEASHGFRPFTEPEHSLHHLAKEHGDPLVKYRGMNELEPILADSEPVLESKHLNCPDCGGTEEVQESGYSPRNVYRESYHCKACDESFSGYHLHLLPSPSGDCPECGQIFEERSLQYPELGSNAYECRGCGFITFDALDRESEELDPDVKREDVVGPDVEAYREKQE